MLGKRLDRFATLAWGALAIIVAAGLSFGVALLLGGASANDGKVVAPAGTRQVDSAKDLARRVRVARLRVRAAERFVDAARSRRARNIRIPRVRDARALTSTRRARRATASRSPVVTSPPRRVGVAPPPPPRAPKPKPTPSVTFDDTG